MGAAAKPLKWTDERRAWFRAFVPGHSAAEISAEHERVFGAPLTEGQIANAKTRFGVKSGTVGGRFEKGNTPRNKGRRWDEFMPPESQEACRRSQFKPGNMPHNGHQPIGSEREGVDGYVYVKVAERKTDPSSAHDNWRLKHHLVYEAHHGAIPDDCNIVFADRDRRNFDPANLVAVPRSLWATIRKTELPYHDAESLGAVVNVARLAQARSRARKRPGFTESDKTKHERGSV